MSSVQTFRPPANIAELIDSQQLRSAFVHIDSRLDKITEEQIRICSIPAPPFGEGQRAEYLKERFLELGLVDARLDEEGNCVALRKGHSAAPLLVVSAHLDTVFPVGTDFTVHRAGGKLLAPGISDDGCGLVALLVIAEVLGAIGIETEGSILFVGTVGEEGEGNLRGVRHLITQSEWGHHIDAFISFDGPGIDRITNRALGSRRYRVQLRGTGGHSWGDFGAANPVHALGRAIAKLTSYPVPREPRTTFNVGRIEGGNSVNAIPQVAAMDVDLRSASGPELLKLDAFFRRAMREAAEDENAVRRNGDRPLELKVVLIGERPGGETPADADLVSLAWEATKAMGAKPRLDQSSTDSNLPISLGIPAITLGAGGTSGNSHTVEEWYDPRDRDAGLKRALLVILGTVGLKKQGKRVRGKE
ncbi:MAG: M20/M25/M40 family metallo-hydrolase [Acidobacteriota bacterium]|nr:M20/M25/M40 family metallo-hydrolase [Acidobacteriota bacterium]